MKRLIVFGFLFLALSTFAQKNVYEIECVRCELEYAETYCSTCPNKSGVGVSLFEGIEIRDKKTGKVKAKIPAPFKPRLVGGYVEIYTQSSEREVDGYPTRIRAKFEEYVLSDYSKYDSFASMVDSLKTCGACIVTEETTAAYDDTELQDSINQHRIMLDELDGDISLLQAASHQPASIGTAPDGFAFDAVQGLNVDIDAEDVDISIAIPNLIASDVQDALAEHQGDLDLLAGAEQNVQSDWNETDISNDAFILNKPTLLGNGMFDLNNQNGIWNVTDFMLGGNTNMDVGTNFLSMKSISNEELFIGDLVIAGGAFSLPSAGYKINDGDDYIGSFSTDATTLGGGKSVVLGRFYGNTVGRVGVVYDDSNEQVLISHSPDGSSNQTAQIIVSNSKIILETPDVIANSASIGDLIALKNANGEIERIDPLSLPFLNDLLDDDKDTGITFVEGPGVDEDRLSLEVDGLKFLDFYNNSSGVRTALFNVQDLSGMSTISLTQSDTITVNSLGVTGAGSIMFDVNIGLVWNNGTTWLRMSPEHKSQEVMADGLTGSFIISNAPNNLSELSPIILLNGVEQMSINITSIINNVVTISSIPSAGEILKVHWVLK